MKRKRTTGSPLASEREWRAFLEAEEQATCAAYKAKPRFLERDRKAEKSIQRDYVDRELLELVQNAADAAAEVGGGGSVKIVVGQRGLLVANTGEPFRDTGVEALLTAHLSDKPDRKLPLIGAKGLGFRAILNWSIEPIVLSGSLRLAFSQGHATQRVARLAEEDEEVRHLVGGDPKKFAPVLPFPIVGADVDRWIDPSSAPLLATAEQLRAEGYDTVVLAPFANDQSHREALRQAAEFQPHFLLFVPALARIDIELDGGRTCAWIKQARDNCIELEIVENGASNVETWHCRVDSGEAPIATGEGPNRYEVAVAIRTDQANAVGRLHSFFPTNVILPLTALFHGTFELQSNRKLLQEKSDLNAFVLNRLADLYAETLTDLLRTGARDSVIPFLLKDRPFPSELADFAKRLLAQLQSSAVVPTLGKGNVTPGESILGAAGVLDFLPHRLFPQLARCRSSQERDLLRDLGVGDQDVDQALAAIVPSDLSLDERAALIIGMVRQVAAKQQRRSLLIDDKGQPVGPNSACFPPASGTLLPDMPPWANRRFVHPQLWERLMQGFGLGRRDVIQKLGGFGVQEYDLGGLARALLRRGEAVIARWPARESEIRSDVLAILQKLHAREATPPKWPGLKVKVLALSGEWRSSDEVHLSESYGLDGRITQALFRNRGGALLERADRQGISASEAAATAFFLWVGVHPYPRQITLTSPQAHRDAIMDALPEIFHVTDGSLTQRIAKADVQWGGNAYFETDLPEALTETLVDAPSEAILAWLARDPRLDVAAEPFGFVFKARKNASYFRRYDGDFPDLVRLEIGRTPWLACTDGIRRAPIEVLRDPARLDGIFARPSKPDPALAQAFCLDQALINKALANAGVGSGIEDVPEAAIYEILLDLPTRGLAPEVVKRFYFQLLEREDFDVAAGGAAAARFLETGKVQCRRHDAYEWVSVRDANYADRDGSSALARDHLALIDLPSRRSAANVTARFGVVALSRCPVELSVMQVISASPMIASLIQHRFESALPCIRAFRSLISADGQSLRRLDSLRLHVSTALRTQIVVRGQTYEAESPQWSHLLRGEDLYILVNENAPNHHIPMLAAEVLADGLSDLFEVQNSPELAKLLACEDGEMRRLLLHRMLPNFPREEVEALVAEAPAQDDGTIGFDPQLLILERPDQGSASSGSQGDGQPPVGANDTEGQPATGEPGPAGATGTSPPAHSAAASQTPENKLPSDPETVLVIPVDTPQAGAQGGGPVSLRVQFGSGGGGWGGGSRDPHRPLSAETWAARFEEQQGRFPLAVAHLQGTDALGCDLVSFTNDSERAAFLADGALARIARFIEVKSGGVHLGENQTAAAKKYKERYYVYRIIFDDSAHSAATLTLINDPLSYAAALARELRLHMEDVPDRATFRVLAAPPNEIQEVFAKTA